MAAVAAHREKFEFDHHCSGPNLDATPNDIVRRIERYSGVKLIDGLVRADMSSGDSVADWASRLLQI